MTVNDLLEFKELVQAMLDSGMDLKEISLETFEMREMKMNIPYLAILTKEPKTKKVTCLFASPTRKQKELFEFFNQPVPGSGLPKYCMFVYDSESGRRVQLTERISRTELKEL